MRKVTFIVMVLLYVASSIGNAQPALLVSMDKSIDQSIGLQVAASMNEAFNHDTIKNAFIQTGSSFPPLNVYIRDTLATSISRLYTFEVVNGSIKSPYVTVNAESELLVVLPDQINFNYEKQSTRFNFAIDSLEKWIGEGRVGYITDILPNITKAGDSYIWKGQKIVGLLIL